MVKLKSLINYLDEYLNVKTIPDHSYNGLQIEGRPELKKIIFTVDAGLETFDLAVNNQADMIIVHHGIFWDHSNPSLVGWKKQRIMKLVKKDISLYAVHLPLDTHKKIGHNVQLLKSLGAKVKEPFTFHDEVAVGYKGFFVNPVSINKIIQKLEKNINSRCVVLKHGPKKIKTIAVVSGGGSYKEFADALDHNVDLFITGDLSEFYHVARDSQTNVIFAGHHATEILGLKVLEKLIRNKFKVETEFIDVPTHL